MSTDNTHDHDISPVVLIMPCNTPRFAPGRIYATPGAVAALQEAGHHPGEFLARHLVGDWGDVCPDDVGCNEQSLADGTRLLSVYHTRLGGTIWLITEWDRSASTFLLPEEY